MAYLLIVDDDADFSAAVKTLCESDGHEATVEANPQAVLDQIKTRRPDALILDVMFPENPSAGFEIARSVRRQHPDLPILMLTAVNQRFPLGFSSQDIDSTWLPVTEFIEKPVDFEALRTKIAGLVLRADVDS